MILYCFCGEQNCQDFRTKNNSNNKGILDLKSINESVKVNQSINQAIDHLFNQSINQSVFEKVNHSFIQ